MINEEQREARKLGIGGSDMPIILGLSTYKTPYQLYLEKCGIIDKPMQETPNQYWGSKLEAIIVDEFKRRNNVKVETPDTLIHPFHDYLRANLDGFVPDWNAVLEVKCSSSFMAKEWGEDASDVIPMPYLVQVAHYCAVTNADSAHIAVLIGGFDYREFKYKRDLKLESTVIDAAKYFWECVKQQQPPKAINEYDLSLMYPKSDYDRAVIIDDIIQKQVTALYDVKRKLKELSEIESQYRFQIMQYMQDAECLTDAQGVPLVTWKNTKRGNRTFLLKSI